MYKYYVFISYSRKDSKAAAYLQRQLEHFRIPVKLVPKELLPAGQKFLRPVFRDKRDLENSERSFTKDIEKALGSSHYLLVLCSPNAAVSTWVNDTEIRYFLKVNGNDFTRVVPVVLDGAPGCGDKEKECLPPELRRPEITSRNLPTMIPDDGEPLKDGWENGVVQSLSYMLKVEREKIKATVDREKLRQTRIYAVIGLCAALIFAALTVWALHAEKKARDQADFAQKSLNFLSGIFRSGDPTENGGSKDMKVLDAIKAKLPEIPKLTPWQLQASVSRHVASILRNLGEYSAALPLFQDALNLYESHDPQSLSAADIYNEIALYNASVGGYKEAIEFSQKTLAIISKKYGKNHIYAATVNDSIGVFSCKLKQYGAAIKFHEKALKIRRKKLGENHPDTATTYANLGAVHLDKSEYKEAISFFKKALAVYTKKLGENHIRTATVYNNIGIAYSHLRKYDYAAQFLGKALEIRRKKLGDSHPDTAVTYANLGTVHYAKGELGAAISHYEKTLAVFLKRFGKNNPKTTRIYLGIAEIRCKQGQVAFRQGRYDDAAKLFGNALETYGENNINSAACCCYAAACFWKLDRREEALRLAEKAVAIAEKTLGKDHHQTKLYTESLNEMKKQMRK